MDWTTIPPSLVAAVSGLIGVVVGSGISAWTTRRTHKERLAADQALAERKFEFDCTLAERKAESDASVAEKKIALDRAFAAWKRKTEFAEDVLADFYEARDVIRAARSPATFSEEGKTRPKETWESESDTRTLNSYYATTERLFSKSEFFAQLFSRCYRFLALFGQEGMKPYDELYRIRHEILISVGQLITTHRFPDRGSVPQARQRWEDVVWDAQNENDPINGRLNAVVEAIESICRPVIQAVGEQ
jgi:hypothetical protein